MALIHPRQAIAIAAFRTWRRSRPTAAWRYAVHAGTASRHRAWEGSLSGLVGVLRQNEVVLVTRIETPAPASEDAFTCMNNEATKAAKSR